MCGRYVATTHDDVLAQRLGVAQVIGGPWRPSWNVAPTQRVRVAVERADADGGPTGVRQLRSVRWGLVPSWAKAPNAGPPLINARVETVTTKPSFRAAAARRRALFPMDGYYEWQKTGSQKVPYYLSDPDSDLLVAAGLYELWPDPAKDEDDPDRWLWSGTIITTVAPDTLGHIHDRSPLFVPAEMWDEWLDPDVASLDDVRSLLDGVPPVALTPRQVGTAVGSVRNNSPELLAPA